MRENVDENLTKHFRFANTIAHAPQSNGSNKKVKVYQNCMEYFKSENENSQPCMLLQETEFNEIEIPLCIMNKASK